MKMFGNNYTNPYAYNGISGMGYNGYNSNPYYGAFQQPAQSNSQQSQTQPVPQPTTVTNTNKIYVSGIDDVKARFLSPNSDVLFVDNDKPLLYQKVVDSKGQFEIKTFDIVLHKAEEMPIIPDSSNLSNFATKDDLDPLRAEIKALNEKISKLDVQKQIDSIKKDEIKPLKRPENQ